MSPGSKVTAMERKAVAAVGEGSSDAGGPVKGGVRTEIVVVVAEVREGVMTGVTVAEVLEVEETIAATGVKVEVGDEVMTDAKEIASGTKALRSKD